MIQLVLLWWGLMSSAVAGDGFDHSHTGLREFLTGAVDNAGVDYQLLARRRSKLDSYLAIVAEAPVSSFSTNQKLAFWVNAYNAYTVALILDEKMPKSIMDLDGGKVWDTRLYPVAGQRLSLNAMEHEKARPLTDGRVHAALNCASKGCPPLGTQPLRADSGGPSMESQLDTAARRWVSTNAYSKTGDGIVVSQIFDWFTDDFQRWGGTENEDSGKKSRRAIGFLSEFGAPMDGASSVAFQSYDWSLNQR